MKKTLLVEVQKIILLFNLQVIYEKVKAHKLEVMCHPPYHCQLNPIELFWSQVKRHVALNNNRYEKLDILQDYLEPLLFIPGGFNKLVVDNSPTMSHVIGEFGDAVLQ